MVVPINRIPPEVLALIPDFLDVDDRDEDVIALTHVCRAWREVFTSRPSLWTHLDLDYQDEVEASVYLERSKSMPIQLSLDREDLILPSDTFFQIIPRVVGRLGHLVVRGTPENIQHITNHLSRPAPLLEHLTISVYSKSLSHRHPVFTPTLFDGDLSSLRSLDLGSIRTELPWRNMVNLTTFSLRHTPPGETSVGHLLDFFESAPHLREVSLYFATPTSGVQNGRLVSLAHLRMMRIVNRRPSSVLLDHLLIPAGAELVLQADFVSSLVGDLLPRCLNNLRNLSNFTTVKQYIGGRSPCMELSGPNGRVRVNPTAPRISKTSLVLEFLLQLDTSKTERFRIENGEPLSEDLFYRALLRMIDLRVVTLYRCHNPHIFIRALYPSTSSSEAVICPKLEELVLVLRYDGDVFDMENVIGMAEARASRGKELETVRIVDGGNELDPKDVLELRRHVGHVEYSPRSMNDGEEGGRGGSW